MTRGLEDLGEEESEEDTKTKGTAVCEERAERFQPGDYLGIGLRRAGAFPLTGFAPRATFRALCSKQASSDCPTSVSPPSSTL
jgi:hypothetical protein